ncbi:MAG: glycoside hydrolase family 38 N-terminal domain-containing protein, partial [Planctomycetota bacterium]|jgi:alpha-mannosidase
MEYEPQRIDEFRQLVKQKRIELVNAFVLEPTINLSGGEALVQQGIQGLRWYKQIMDQQPRYCWMIDTVGWHEQMAQIVSGLGLEAFVYCRNNPTKFQTKQNHAIHQIQSPDGTRSPAFGLGHYYRNFNKAFRSAGALTREELRAEIESAQKKKKTFPTGAPVLLLGGDIDYSLPFKYENYPAELIEAWNAEEPNLPIHISTFSDYIDVILPAINSDRYEIPLITSGSYGYNYSAFWINAPFYKQWYRRTEHLLGSTEAIATIANLKTKVGYNSQKFANSWLLMSLNMDRNLLWGVGVDETFYDANSWDTRDRFEYIERACTRIRQKALSTLTLAQKDSVTVFNPINWTRTQPFEINLPKGMVPAEYDFQLLDDSNTVLVNAPLRSFGLSSMKLREHSIKAPLKTTLPESIETIFYSAKIDPNTGDLISLKLKPSGRQMLVGPANTILAESKGNPHWVPSKSKRTIITTSADHKPTITVAKGKLATIIKISSSFHGDGQLLRIIRFYNNSRRIDFVTQTENIPPETILSTQFPLADQITDVRRGIPYGFSHCSWAQKDSGLSGIIKDIFPAIRWSDYNLNGGGGIALLDRGLPARELVDNTIILMLHNVCDTYYNRKVKWMNHIGKQTYEYALVVHDKQWNKSNIPQIAWQYNSPVITMPGRTVAKPESFIETSNNVIIQALRRDGKNIEIRMNECLGQTGKVNIKINLPHSSAILTDLIGREQKKLTGGPQYTFDVRPQQIITLHLQTLDAVPVPKALTSFDSLVPPHKRRYMSASRNAKVIIFFACNNIQITVTI